MVFISRSGGIITPDLIILSAIYKSIDSTAIASPGINPIYG